MRSRKCSCLCWDRHDRSRKDSFEWNETEAEKFWSQSCQIFETRYKNAVCRMNRILRYRRFGMNSQISELEALCGNATKQSRHTQHCPNTIEYTSLACRSARSSLKRMAWAPVYSRFSSFSVFPDRTTITSHEGGGARFCR